MTEEPRLLGGRYEVGALLGRGGMAEVRRARDARLGREVAVKQLRVDLATDPTFQMRFQREAQAAARLNHPNIVSVHDTGEEPDPTSSVMVPYIVMELVEGHTLRELLRSGRKIQPAKALEFTQGVLEALEYSHRAGIVHRDIKPANVMLTPSGLVKVMDFGIARAVADTSATMTQTAAVIGTAQYLSPEQARGETVDARSDIYSAGCLLYELLVGRPPFTGDSPVSVAYQHVREQPVPPSHIDSMITPAMDAITLKALAKDPADRYQSAALMRADIGRLLAGREVTARVPAAPAGAAASATAAMAATTALPNGAATATTPAVGVPATTGVDTDTATQTGVGSRAVVPTRSPRRWWSLWVALVVLLGLGVGIGAFYLLNPAVQTVAVPNVIDRRVAEAQQMLTEADLVPRVVEITGPDDTSVGRVTGQNPLADTKVRVGAEVIIQVNVGPAKQVIPTGLTGGKVDDVVEELGSLGFTNVRSEPDPNEPLSAKTNEVTRLSPAEGANVTLDTEIVVYFARGEATVPNFRGLTRQEAINQAKAGGFATPEFSEQESSAAPGTVIAQEPPVGSVVKRTAVIQLILAKPISTPTPEPTTESPSPTPSEPTDGTEG